MYSKSLSKFASKIKYEDLNNDTVDMTKKCIMDLMGVAIAGCDKPPSLIWEKWNDKLCSRPEATIWKLGFPKTGYSNAACLNAAFGHALDMDDLHNSSILHPGVITIPTAFALGEYYKKSGKEVIAAIVAGYDVAARIGEAINPSSYWFWHTTSIAGNFSSATTAGNLMNLNEDEMNNCFGSAGSQAGGLWEFSNDGAMTKTLHVGKASMNGILSAELASLGFTGASQILEGNKGLIKAIAPEYELDKLISDYANPYKIMETSFKPYACCRHTHSANYAIEEMVRKHGITADSVKTIVDRTYKTALDVTDNANPQTVYAHKFSLQYCIAACLVHGNLLEDVFTEENISNPLVRNTMKKIKVYVDKDIDDEFNKNPEKWIHDLEIETIDGTILRERIEYPLGDVNNPFDWEMTENKFKMLVSPYLSELEIEKFINIIHKIDSFDDINDFFRKLQLS